MRSAGGRAAWVLGTALALGCGMTSEPPASAGPTTEAAVPRTPAHARPSALDALPWVERLGLEQGMAAADARYFPRAGETGPLLGQPGALSASFSPNGARITLGASAECDVSVALRAIGRGELRQVMPPAQVRVAGLAVEVVRGDGITEWWRSLPSGLEHGVTLERRPDGEGTLMLEVSVGGLRAQPRGPDAATLVDADGLVRASYAHLVVLDADGVRVPARMAVADDAVRLEVDDAVARYPLIVDPLVAVEEATLLASGGAADDDFGYSVSLSTDGTHALVGAYGDDTPGGIGAGSARVFVRSGATWTEQATLLASDGVAGDVFGYSVSLSADGSRALVGAYAAAAVGSARVFVRSGTTWTEEATLLASGGAAGDAFGYSVSLSADGSRALVGAVLDDTPGGDAGSARVFVRSGTTWTEEATLLASDGAPNDQFGCSVSLSADGSRALVGAVVDDTPGGVEDLQDAGSARVFVRSGTTWAEEATLLAADGAVRDEFGVSVSLSADGSRAIVGAHHDDTPTSSAGGSARVFTRSGTTWTEEATLLASGAGGPDNFGYSVSLSADGSLALVGAWLDDTPGGASAGSARVFLRTGSIWVEQLTLLASGGAAGDRFGHSVALSPDGSRALVGAYLDDIAAPGTNEGSARVFTLMFAPPAADGTPCSDPRQCISGSCADGVCCENSCGGGASNDCQACSVATGSAADGTCTSLSAAVAPTIICRPSAPSGCDLAETCAAGSSICPVDVVAPSTTVCRPISGPCDLAEESCTGTAAVCPSDVFASDGTSCADSDACDGEETCGPLGRCLAGIALDCDDGDACTADACIASGCSHTPVPGCGVDAGTTADAGTAADAGASEDAGGSFDAGLLVDASADRDAGPGRDLGASQDSGAALDAAASDASADSGCSCRATGGSTRRGENALAWLALYFVLIATRRRRR